MLEHLNQNQISEVISISKEILELLCIEGYEKLEDIVRKTKTLAEFCDDNEKVVWLWFELNGLPHPGSFKNLDFEDNSKYKGLNIWKKLHQTQDSGEKIKLFKKMYNELRVDKISMEVREKVYNLKREEFELPYSNVEPACIAELVYIAKSPPVKKNENFSDIDFFFYEEISFRHDNCRMVIRRIRNEVNDYVTEVYKEAIKIRGEINNKIKELTRENELLRKRTIENRIKNIFYWIKKHKVATSIITFVMLIASIFTILMFLGYDLEDILAWFSL